MLFLFLEISQRNLRDLDFLAFAKARTQLNPSVMSIEDAQFACWPFWYGDMVSSKVFLEKVLG